MAAEVSKGGRVKKFLKEVRNELRKVNWPNRKELVSYTSVVLSTVVVFAIFFGIFDYIFSSLLSLLARL